MSVGRIAIIGCGKQASKHVEALKRAGSSLDPLFVDTDPQAAEGLAQRFGGRAVADLETALDDPRVSAVDVCTPTPSHYPIIKAALEAGRHVFCEKPLCQTHREAEHLVRMQQEAGVVGMVGYLYRFSSPFQTLWRLCNTEPQRPLGEPVLGLLRIGGRGSHQAWKHLRAEGGGVRNEMLVHMIDLATWCLGAPETVERVHERLLRPQRLIQGAEVAVDAEDYTVVRLTTAAGTEVLIEADLLTPCFSQHVEVQGTNGSFCGSIQAERPSFVHLIEGRGSYPAGRSDLAAGGDDPFARQMRAFLDAIDGERPLGFASFEDSLHTSDALQSLHPPVQT